jgi:hypothetical protein
MGGYRDVPSRANRGPNQEQICQTPSRRPDRMGRAAERGDIWEPRAISADIAIVPGLALLGEAGPTNISPGGLASGRIPQHWLNYVVTVNSATQ